MASVTFDTVVGGDGSTVTDDDDPSTGLGNGGHLIRTVPMMAQVVAVANHVVTVAGGTGQDAIDAQTAAASAAASAAIAADSVDLINQLGAASALQTTGDIVTVNLASPPTTGQVLTATNATNAAWQTIPSPPSTPDFLLINAGII